MDGLVLVGLLKEWGPLYEGDYQGLHRVTVVQQNGFERRALFFPRDEETGEASQVLRTLQQTQAGTHLALAVSARASRSGKGTWLKAFRVRSVSDAAAALETVGAPAEAL